MKIVYAGTPEFAVAPLEQLLSHGFSVVAVITQPDKPQGRKGILTPSPVKQAAERHQIPVLQPVKIRNELDSVRALGGELMVTCAYGQILSAELLDSFSMGVYNIHASLLPKYRGASPIQWCVLNGERETGITIMRTDVGLDTGDIFLQKKLPLAGETAGELSERLSVLGGEAIVEALEHLPTLTPVKQDESKATLVKKICKEDAFVDFTWSAEKVVRWIKGMNPTPVAYAMLNGAPFNFYNAERAEGGNEAPGTILSDSPKQGFLVQCGDGAVKLTEVQASGGKRMRASDFLNGRKVAKGQKFNDESHL